MKNPIYILCIFCFGISSSLSAQSPDYIYPESFGIEGKGADETEKLQAALLACSESESSLFISDSLSIRVTGNLYVYGTFDIIGENTNAEIYLDGALNTDMNDGFLWINFGIPSKGAEGIGYSGTISNLTFRVTEKARVYRMLYFHKANNFKVSNCFFDVRAVRYDPLLAEDIHHSWFKCNPIGCGSYFEWCSNGCGADYTRKNGRFINNTCLANQTTNGGEGIGIRNATNIIISGNIIEGFGDDPIGCHNVHKLTIANNHCSTVLSRILINNCTDTRVIGNIIERSLYEPIDSDMAPASGGGELIKAGIEVGSRGEKPAPSRIIIEGNQLIIPDYVPDSTTGIRLFGARDVLVSNNQIICDAYNGGPNCIKVQPDKLSPEWIDPTGIDTEGIARPRNITITGNTCGGKNPQGINLTGVTEKAGPFFVSNNTAGHFRWYFNTSFGHNDVYKYRGDPDYEELVPENPMQIDGMTSTASKLLFIGSARIRKGDSEMLTRNSNLFFKKITQFHIERQTRITYFDVTLDKDILSGHIKVRLEKFSAEGDLLESGYAVLETYTDGVLLRKEEMNSESGDHNRFAMIKHKRHDFATCNKGEYIRVSLVGSDDLSPARIYAVVNVNGISW